MLFEQVMQRPSHYDSLISEQQWHIDRELGILDWNGSCDHQRKGMCAKCSDRYYSRFSPRRITVQWIFRQHNEVVRRGSAVRIEDHGNITNVIEHVYEETADGRPGAFARRCLRQAINFLSKDDNHSVTILKVVKNDTTTHTEEVSSS